MTVYKGAPLKPGTVRPVRVGLQMTEREMRVRERMPKCNGLLMDPAYAPIPARRAYEAALADWCARAGNCLADWPAWLADWWKKKAPLEAGPGTHGRDARGESREPPAPSR
jgi:hypothetical protein